MSTPRAPILLPADPAFSSLRPPLSPSTSPATPEERAVWPFDYADNLYTLLTLLSEYLIAFDLWAIVELLDFVDTGGSVRHQIVVLIQTCLLYSLLEPIAYTIGTSFTAIGMLPLLSSVVIENTIISLLRHHKTMTQLEQLESFEAGKPVVAESGTTTVNKTANARVTQKTVVTVLLTASAAFTAASLRLCTQYLPTANSHEWFVRFKVGWYTIAIFSLCAFFAAKLTSFATIRDYASPSRPKKRSATWDVGTKLLIILFINLARATARHAFTQQQHFTSPVVCPDESGFCIQPEFRNGDMYPPAPSEAYTFDKILDSTPPWVGHVCTLLNFCIAAGQWWLALRIKARFARATDREPEGVSGQLDQDRKSRTEQQRPLSSSELMQGDHKHKALEIRLQ
nr:hypothetical protein CFP56_74585 [Quercus suber]